MLAAPKLVAISFQNDTLQASVDTFATQIAANTAYWSATTSEYGVGPLTAVTYHAAEDAVATLTDADVQAWLTNKIQNDTTFPKPDANTIYTLFYPKPTAVTSGGGTSCFEFQGYHDAYPLSASSNVVYAIVPRCDPPVTSITLADEMTAEASHEVIEAAIDPLPGLKPNYITVDADSHAWEMLAGGEVGDLCAGFPGAFYKPTGFDNLVQRTWSNQAAAASHDPCQPNGASAYFNSAPALPDTITVAVSGKLVKTKGIKLAVGATTTIEVDLFSDAPTTGPWKLTAIDVTSAFFGGAPALSISFDNDTGQNGDKINLTIKYLKAVSGGALYWLQSDLGSVTTVWLGAVSTN